MKSLEYGAVGQKVLTAEKWGALVFEIELVNIKQKVSFQIWF